MKGHPHSESCIRSSHFWVLCSIRLAVRRFGFDDSKKNFLYSAWNLVALLIIGFEMRVRQASLKTLIGAAVGSILGIAGAFDHVLISIQRKSRVSRDADVSDYFAGFLWVISALWSGRPRQVIDLSALGLS
jgi:hypothetical protein